jgi:hypothetical protein
MRQFRRVQRVGPVPGRGRDHVPLPDVPDRPEAVPGQQVGHGLGREDRLPRLAPLGGGLPDQVRVDLSLGVAQPGGQHVVHHDLAARREAAEHRHGRLDDAGVEVHGDAEATDKGRPAGVEPGPSQRIGQRVPREVHRDERHPICLSAPVRCPGAPGRLSGAPGYRPDAPGHPPDAPGRSSVMPGHRPRDPPLVLLGGRVVNLEHS